MPADRINPRGPELAPDNLCECGPRSLRADPGPALRFGGRRGGVWRSGAARGVVEGAAAGGEDNAPRAARRGAAVRPRPASRLPRARAVSQHLTGLLFPVLKVVPSPPSSQFAKSAAPSSRLPPLPALMLRVFALGYRGAVHP